MSVCVYIFPAQMHIAQIAEIPASKYIHVNRGYIHKYMCVFVCICIYMYRKYI